MDLLLVNFGGPRTIEEVPDFLRLLLTDRDVVRAKMPGFAHRLFFSWVARRRAVKVQEDYRLIGGGSPIYRDTEDLAELLRKKLDCSVTTFHRYLGQTHDQTIDELERCEGTITVFPLFPQFTYATTGSIARFMANELSRKTLHQLRWIKSYPTHPLFVQSHVQLIKEFIDQKRLDKPILIFSAHGLPQQCIDEGDVYQKECEASYQAIQSYFPDSESQLCYQSQFGRSVWIKPYTIDICSNPPRTWIDKSCIVVPLSFTSDHIETLFEIEQLYLPPLRAHGLDAHRLPALNLREDWVDAICTMIQSIDTHHHTHHLIAKR